MLKQMMVWEQTTLKKLESAGFVKNIGIGKYELVDAAIAWAERPKPRPDFKLGKNHIKLLEKNCAHANITEGTSSYIIRSADLKHEHDGKPQHEYNRQAKMIDGMIKSLIGNGYLTRMEKGCYQLTENAINALAQSRTETDIAKTVQSVKKEQPKSKARELKITEFDRHLLTVTDEQRFIRDDFIEAHERGESIKKRIVTLTKAGLVKDGKITPELEQRINTATRLSRSKTLTADMLTIKQRKVLEDIRIFMNLSPSQIANHIYHGNSELFNLDISMLLRHDILEKKTELSYNVYVLGKSGSELLRQINSELPIFKSKIDTRPEEVGHDMLIYTAYKDVEKKIKQDGGKIVLLQNDRMLRSEDIKKLGCMKEKGEYPDLRITYTDKLVTKCVHNLEIDCGYDTKTINAKLSAFFKSSTTGSFSWCCKTIRQASKVARIASSDKSRSLKKHKPLYISYVDEKGNVKKLKWS